MALLKKGSPIALIEVTLVVNNQICIRSVFASKVWLAELSLRDRMMSMDIWKELRDVEMKQLGWIGHLLGASLWRFSVYTHLREDPWADQGLFILLRLETPW